MVGARRYDLLRSKPDKHMTPDERATYDRMFERFKRSPEVKDSVDALRMSYKAHCERRASLRRKRLLLALEIVLGMAAAAIVLAVTFGFLLEHAK